MPKKQFTLCLIAIFGLLQFGPASAISIDFLPSNSTINLGDSINVDVVVSGLDDAGEIVSTYDLDVLYDSSILSAKDVSFSDSLGGEFVSFQNFLIFPDDPANPGTNDGLIDFAELNFFLSDDELAALQGDTTVLATLSFEAIGIGVSSLMFGPDPVFGIDIKGRGPNHDVLAFDEVGIGSVSVVPIPGAALLMLTGLLGIGVASRKGRRSV